MANVTITTVWSDGQVLTSAALNGQFNNLLNNLQIVNADISSGAAIALTKLAGTFPASGLIVGTTDSQTLTNKTIAFASNTLTGVASTGTAQSFTATKTFAATVQTITSYSPAGAATATLDLSLGNVFTVNVPAGNITIAVSNPTVGQCFIVRFVNDTSVRTITWFSTLTWANSTPPTLSGGTGKVDTFGFIIKSSGNYEGYIIGQNVG